ncbi:hypothetical protein GCM10023335_71700 [Streptomyces siamensis]|uniref:Uncharacterized protein n=1 Tax=Streptomyces siamensis TaxID=1274986 RepID=A0ABP9JGS4_9ACTN
MWEVRLWEELLLNTDSFCVAAGRAARGDRTMGDPSGQNRAVRGTRCMGPCERFTTVRAVGLL